MPPWLRRLAEVPRLTAGEWDWLRDGLASLPPEQLREIDQDIAALAELPSRPIVCPLLDRSAGGFTVMASSRAWPMATGPGVGAIRTPWIAVSAVWAIPAI